MALKPLRRNYSFSDGELLDTSERIILAANRDAADLARFGFTAAKLAAVATARDAFYSFPQDEFYSGDMMAKTRDKNIAMGAMGNAAEEIVQRAILKFKKDSGEVARFKFQGYAKFKEAEKVMACETVVDAANLFLAQLADFGLTAAIISDLQTKIEAAKTARRTKADAVMTRDQKVGERVSLGNELYTMLTEIADTGKTLYENTDETKYNDYVLYGSDGTQTVSGTSPAAQIHAPSVSFDSEEQGFKFTNNGPKNLIIYFAADPTDEPTAITKSVDVGATVPMTAGELGWSATNVYFLIKNDSTEDCTFKLVVS